MVKEINTNDERPDEYCNRAAQAAPGIISVKLQQLMTSNLYVSRMKIVVLTSHAR
jgi:hypothetical protein